MIPLKLQIKNFLSYGPALQTVEFGTYPLICLSGKNGHGKSALLDALTWSVWGQARKTTGNSKADQGLLRLGETQMLVCFDFICNDRHYRIRREFMQTYGKPVALLDFSYLSEDNRYISLTEKTIKDTQLKIEKTLHITFDSFVNSAFLRQGQSNEFSKKSPRERKDVLAAILGLDHYEVIRKRASEEMRTLSLQTAQITTLIHKLDTDLTQLPAVQASLIIQEKKHKELLAQLHDEQKTATLFAQEIAAEQNLLQALELKKFQQQQLLASQAQIRDQLRALRTEWKTAHAHSLKKVDLQQLIKKKEALLTVIAHQHSIVQQSLDLQHQILSTKEELAAFMNDLQKIQSEKNANQRISIERLESEKKHSNASAQAAVFTMQKIQEEVHLLSQQAGILENELKKHSLAVDLERTEAQFEKRKERYHTWVARAHMVAQELSAIEQKNLLVHDEIAPSCPLCEQNLSASRRRFLKNKFEIETNAKKAVYKRLSRALKLLKPLLIEQHECIEFQKKEQQKIKLLHMQREEIEKNCSKQLNALNEMQALATKYNEHCAILEKTIQQEHDALMRLSQHAQEELASNTVHGQLLAKLQHLQQQQSTLAYDKNFHLQAQNELASIEQDLTAHAQMQQNYLLQEERSHRISVLCKDLKTVSAQLRELTCVDQCQQESQNTILQLQNKMQLSHLRQQELQKINDELLLEQGSLRTRKTQLEQMTVEHATLKKKLAQSATILDNYQAIVMATGKDGIQALLIENALPEIEQEANDLLAKLTDNQTQLSIESLRDLKKGGTKETLDIKISDAVGIRPYELFSGGEAFRIDFALRIAISKLLARRSGTSLQTLIIDEGFGSQDEEGLSHIMDALYKIQDDFAKIIIISHLSIMKNQFPVHFLIEKGPQGSIVQVLEQD